MSNDKMIDFTYLRRHWRSMLRFIWERNWQELEADLDGVFGRYEDFDNLDDVLTCGGVHCGCYSEDDTT